MGAGPDLAAAGAHAAAALVTQQRGGEGAGGGGPARAGRPGEQPRVRRFARDGPLELGDDGLLPGELGEYPRGVAHRRCFARGLAPLADRAPLAAGLPPLAP